MQKTYDVTAKTYFEATIDSSDISRILNEEREKVAGGKDCYISSDGTIFDTGGRWTEKIGDATEEQARLYDALELCARHFEGLK